MPCPQVLFPPSNQQLLHYPNSGRHSAPTLPGAPPAGAMAAPVAALQLVDGPVAVEAPKQAPKNNRNKTSKKKGKGAGKGGGQGMQYTNQETIFLLEAMKKYKPIGQVEWQAVHDYYNGKVDDEERYRDVHALRRKYNSLHQKKVPTGDPNIPEVVRIAKKIEKAIVKKSNCVDGEGIEEEFGDEIVVADDEGGSDDEESMPKNTDGEDDPLNEDVLVPKAAAVAAAVPAETPVSRPGKKKKTDSRSSGKRSSGKKSTEEQTTGVLQAFLESERMAAMRERQRERELEIGETRCKCPCGFLLLPQLSQLLVVMLTPL